MILHFIGQGVIINFHTFCIVLSLLRTNTLRYIFLSVSKQKFQWVKLHVAHLLSLFQTDFNFFQLNLERMVPNNIIKKKNSVGECLVFCFFQKFWRSMCILCTPRPIYRLTYRPTLDQCFGRHISQVSTDMSFDVSTDVSTKISAKWWSTYGPTIGRYLGRYSGWNSADTLTIDCRQNIARLSVVYWSKA